MPPAVTRAEAMRRIEARQRAYAGLIRETYAEAERLMIETVARRIERGIDVAATPGWAEKKLAEVDALTKEMGVAVGDLRRLDPRIQEAIEAGYDAGGDAAAQELVAANVADVGADIAGARGMAVRTLAARTVDALSSTHFAVLRAASDVYRSVIAETSAQMATGVLTWRQAAQASLSRFADRGISGFTDSAGRRWDLQSYAEMAVRTATGQAAVQGHIDKLEASDHDLVIVSSHGNCCPLCGPWEGKVLSITGKTPGYPTVADAHAGGLQHPNCRHTLDLYIPGVTRPREMAEYDPEAYKALQRQRELERGVRRWKRREAVAITPEAQRLATAKRTEWQKALRTHIDQANEAGRAKHGEGWIELRRDYGRENLRGVSKAEVEK